MVFVLFSLNEWRSDICSKSLSTMYEKNKKIGKQKKSGFLL